MEKKEIWNYIRIGTDLRYLQDVTTEFPIIFEDGPRDNLRRLLEAFDELRFRRNVKGFIRSYFVP